MTKQEGMKLSASELHVMEVLWERGELRASEVVKVLAERIGWNRNTTYTVIKKCVEKGTIKRIEPNFICYPMISREAVQRYALRKLQSRLFEGDKEKMIHMLEDL